MVKIKCSACSELITMASIKKGVKHRNPFKRRIIQCGSCKEFLKASVPTYLLAWVIVVSIPFAAHTSNPYVFSVLIISALIQLFLMSEGHSHQRLPENNIGTIETPPK